MQITITGVQPPAPTPMLSFGSTGISLSRGTSDCGSERSSQSILTVDQEAMKATLDGKKTQVINRLLYALSHANTGDIEASLNASSILCDLIKETKTFDLFLEDETI